MGAGVAPTVDKPKYTGTCKIPRKPPVGGTAGEPDDPARLIFEPGLTTATELDDVSGRGMGMDVVHVLRKGRHDLRGLRIALTAERAQEDPHRITAVTIDFTVTGDIAKEQIQRAIDLLKRRARVRQRRNGVNPITAPRRSCSPGTTSPRRTQNRARR